MDSPESGEPPATKKRRSNVGKACLNCRRRKAKCDGIPPTCRTCATYNDICSWDDNDDGRKPVSKQYVKTLQDRIKALEAQLESKGQALPPIASEEVGGSEDGYEEGTSSQTGQMAQTMLHLYVGNAGEEVHFHGPTSAFALPAVARTPRNHVMESTSDPLEDVQHDYRRHLPRSVELTFAQHSTVLDRFFRFYASWGMRATASLFHNDLIRAVTLPANTPPVRFSYYSPFLHNIILSIALRFADDEQLRHIQVRSVFAAEADKYLKVEMLRPTLATVQGLAMKSSWHSLSGQHSAGWVYFGMAERLARSMGLHIDCAPLVEKGRMSSTEMVLRRDTFWNIFCQEQCWSVYMGRSNAMQDYSTPLPTVSSELDEQPWVWDNVDSSARGSPPQPSMYSTTFVQSAKLAIIMQKVMNALYSLKSDVVKLHRDSTISELGLAIDTWNEQLPAALVISGQSKKHALPHILMLQLAKEWLILLLYRPYYRPVVRLPVNEDEGGDEVTSAAVQRCDRSAARINTLLQLYEEQIGLRYSGPTLLHIAFTAGTTHLLAAVRQRSVKSNSAAMQRARECCGFLRAAAVSWYSAEYNAEILQSLIKEYDPSAPLDIESVVPHNETANSVAPSHFTSTAPIDIRSTPSINQSSMSPIMRSGASMQSQSQESDWQPGIISQQRIPLHSTTSNHWSAVSDIRTGFSPNDMYGQLYNRVTANPIATQHAISPSNFVNPNIDYTSGNPPPTMNPFLRDLFAHVDAPPLQNQQQMSTSAESGRQQNGGGSFNPVDPWLIASMGSLQQSADGGRGGGSFDMGIVPGSQLTASFPPPGDPLGSGRASMGNSTQGGMGTDRQMDLEWQNLFQQ